MDAELSDSTSESEVGGGSGGSMFAETTCFGAWWPNSGFSSAGPAGVANRRFLFQDFHWSADRVANLACYGNVTYEAEFRSNNYDGLRYFGGTTAWGSNLPRDYLDTGFRDSSSEPSRTVGSADATRIAANKNYFTSIRTKLGNSSTDTAKLQGQRGHRSPSWCHITWCVFADATEPLVPAWQYMIPGSVRWTR